MQFFCAPQVRLFRCYFLWRAAGATFRGAIFCAPQVRLFVDASEYSRVFKTPSRPIFKGKYYVLGLLNITYWGIFLMSTRVQDRFLLVFLWPIMFPPTKKKPPLSPGPPPDPSGTPQRPPQGGVFLCFHILTCGYKWILRRKKKRRGYRTPSSTPSWRGPGPLQEPSSTPSGPTEIPHFCWQIPIVIGSFGGPCVHFCSLYTYSNLGITNIL